MNLEKNWSLKEATTLLRSVRWKSEIAKCPGISVHRPLSSFLAVNTSSVSSSTITFVIAAKNHQRMFGIAPLCWFDWRLSKPVRSAYSQSYIGLHFRVASGWPLHVHVANPTGPVWEISFQYRCLFISKSFDGFIAGVAAVLRPWFNPGARPMGANIL